MSFLDNSEYNHDQYDEFYANIIGTQVLKWLKECHAEFLSAKWESKIMSVLQEIEFILNDNTSDDSECFYRIDAIVRAFQNAGISVNRHWELDQKPLERNLSAFSLTFSAILSILNIERALFAQAAAPRADKK